MAARGALTCESHPMKKTLLFTTLLAAVCLGALAGCPAPPPKVEVKDPKGGTKSGAGDKFGLDVLRQASDVPHYREALVLFNTRLQSNEARERLLAQGEKARPFLTDKVNLTPEELLEVESTAFR